jgi:HAD superfamily phosphoserine phosphatase-like hydrolase
MSTTRSAAFFRVEGTLIGLPTTATALWLTAQVQAFSDRLLRLGTAILAAPLTLAGPWKDASLASRLAWMGLRGMSADRLETMAQTCWERLLAPRVKPVGRELVQAAKKEGHAIVLLSDNLTEVIRPLAEEIGATALSANRLELVRGRATGRLEDPVLTAPTLAQWMKSYAAEQGFELGRCLAYGTSAADGILLSAAGRPCAVDPDGRLRRMAADLEWPTVLT